MSERLSSDAYTVATAKAARNHRTGLKSMISGPFFIGSLVGVGRRLMDFGPGLGTLAGTLEPMPLCASWAHAEGWSCEPTRQHLAPLQCVALQSQCTHWRIPSWTIRSPSVCPHRWVARSGEPLAAWDAGLRTSSAWHSRRSFREHRQPTVNEPNGWSTSSARCRRESPTWQSDIVSTFSRR